MKNFKKLIILLTIFVGSIIFPFVLKLILITLNNILSSIPNVNLTFNDDAVFFNTFIQLVNTIIIGSLSYEMYIINQKMCEITTAEKEKKDYLNIIEQQITNRKNYDAVIDYSYRIVLSQVSNVFELLNINWDYKYIETSANFNSQNTQMKKIKEMIKLIYEINKNVKNNKDVSYLSQLFIKTYCENDELSPVYKEDLRIFLN